VGEYDVFKRMEIYIKLVEVWQLSIDNPLDIALKALSIANLPGKDVLFKQAHRPILELAGHKRSEGEASIEE